MQACIITHVEFENSGVIESFLHDAGWTLRFMQATRVDWAGFDPFQDDLWIVMGGPVGVYEGEKFPFLELELAALRKRILANRPILGICLGAQLLAKAAGGVVVPGNSGKELGWFPLTPGRDYERFPYVQPFFQKNLAVLHWHGDTIVLPPEAMHLAATSRYGVQAFCLGAHNLGLQFHAEPSELDLEAWYVGHSLELAFEGSQIIHLRHQAKRYADQARSALCQVLIGWFQQWHID